MLPHTLQHTGQSSPAENDQVPHVNSYELEKSNLASSPCIIRVVVAEMYFCPLIPLGVLLFGKCDPSPLSLETVGHVFRGQVPMEG